MGNRISTRNEQRLDAGAPLRDAQILARHAAGAPPSTTTGNLDRHGVQFSTAYIAGV